MLSILSLIFILAIPLTFGLAIAYYLALRNFQIAIASELPEIWGRARNGARPFESSAQTAYRLLEKLKEGQIDGNPINANLKVLHRKAKVLLYSSAFSFMLLLFSALFSVD